MEQIFLTSEKGLTSTSANYLGNLAKEHIKTLQKELEDFSAFDEFKQLISSSERIQTKVGKNNIDIFETNIKIIADLNSFVAWLREAIEYKDKLLNSVNELIEDRLPEAPVLPKRVVYTKDDVFKSWDRAKIARYYALEAKAAHYGKLIHPSGTFATMRDYYYKNIYSPKSIRGEGRDAIVTTLSPTFEADKLEKVFMSLQSKYREFEKQFNALKFEMQEEADRLNQVAITTFQEALEEYQILLNQYNAQRSKLILEETERISKLKILVPERFNDVFTLLSKMVDSNKA